MASSSPEVENGRCVMRSERVPAPLVDRLGSEAADALLEFMEREHLDWRAGVTGEFGAVRMQIAELGSTLRQDMAAMESGIRQDMTKLESGIRQDMGKMEAGIRQDMSKLESGIRQDMAKLESGIRQDMTAQGAALRVDMAAGRAELLKWSFLFWIGQILTVATLMALMLRLAR
jgi:hypothetical protein